MEEKLNADKRFVKITKDKFTETATTEFVWPKGLSDYFDFKDMITRSGSEIHLNLRGVREEKNIESILIDINFSAYDWIFLRNGNMILNLDDSENIILEFKETQTKDDTKKILKKRSLKTTTEEEVGSISELGFYKLSKVDLKKICEAEKVDIRISGGNSNIEITHGWKTRKLLFGWEALTKGEKFIFMCRGFYAGFFDDNSYNSYLEKIYPTQPLKPEKKDEKQENNSTSTSSKSEGCFVATATLGDYNHPVVLDLRKFRDLWLSKRLWGIKFIEHYYRFGPKLASVIGKYPLLRKLSLSLIVKPLHYVTKIILR